MRKSIVYTLIACLLASSLPFSVTADATDDIPTNAAGTGVHDSLVAALTQADLVTTLQGDGPFTVFAPTDQAFTDAGIDLTTAHSSHQVLVGRERDVWDGVHGELGLSGLCSPLARSRAVGQHKAARIEDLGVVVVEPWDHLSDHITNPIIVVDEAQPVHR